ncbi:hypothetical protein [Novosphingobium jiangmenense]|uniref:Uncharacterized protein n=1 Tax=Novosphingobium jiangmenense TaxID=2791981 RepID=A0ABS0HL60_9SPHN|nr:hypothetical protein [Novosphingobium jiangmenense]MBF9152992.1 hypothetical protein [Novosphingobium jiangmenense]
MTGTLAIVTLVAGLLIGVFLLMRFLSKRGNRHPMEGERERNYEQMQREAEARGDS